jgi:Fe-S-cluster containining protein
MNINDQKKMVEDIDSGIRKTISMNDKFKFACNGCGKCCFDNDIVVNLYDLIRLRHGLKKSTQEILKEDYLDFYIGPSSGLPIITLNFKKFNHCPFLAPVFDFNDIASYLKGIGKEELIDEYKSNPNLLMKELGKLKVSKYGCSVHDDRPIICKLFPCGRIQKVDKKTKAVEESFILQDSEQDRKFCPGFQSQTEQTLNEFLTSQEFWQSKEGSATFTSILDWLAGLGFFAPTKDNEDDKQKALFRKDSQVLMFLGNILYNFDSFNTFSQDPRVRKTIYDKDATQEDFMYVENKVFDTIKGFTNMMNNKTLTEKDFQQFINSLTLGGENLNDN